MPQSRPTRLRLDWQCDVSATTVESVLQYAFDILEQLYYTLFCWWQAGSHLGLFGCKTYKIFPKGCRLLGFYRTAIYI